MATARDTIENALREIGGVEAGETMDAEDAVDGLKRLNAMMQNISTRTGDTGWTDVVLTDNLPVRDRHIPAIEHLLVRWLAPMHGETLTANQAIFAGDAESTLLAAYSDLPELDIDRGLENRIDRFGNERF